MVKARRGHERSDEAEDTAVVALFCDLILTNLMYAGSARGWVRALQS
jgi:hypothetical protein